MAVGSAGASVGAAVGASARPPAAGGDGSSVGGCGVEAGGED